jgi:hypothetical protein
MPHHQPHYEITRTDISAFKAADRVYFQHQAHGNASFIICEKRAPEPSPSNPFPVDQHRVIACNVLVRAYGGETGYSCTSPEIFNAYSTPARSGVLLTLAAFLKAGDILTLEWIASNNNDVMTDAGLVRDDLHVLVKRGDKRGNFQLFDFFMATHSCEPVARMVKANAVKVTA